MSSVWVPSETDGNFLVALDRPRIHLNFEPFTRVAPASGRLNLEIVYSRPNREPVRRTRIVLGTSYGRINPPWVVTDDDGRATAVLELQAEGEIPEDLSVTAVSRDVGSSVRLPIGGETLIEVPSGAMTPSRIGDRPFASRPRQLIAGQSIRVALLDDGTVWVSQKPTARENRPQAVEHDADWSQVEPLADIRQVVLTSAVLFGLGSDGVIWAYRDPSARRLCGDFSEQPERYSFADAAFEVAGIAASDSVWYAWTTEGAVRAGAIGSRAVGLGSIFGVETPEQVPHLPSDIIQVAAVETTVHALTRSGDVYRWEDAHPIGENDVTAARRSISTRIDGVERAVRLFPSRRSCHAVTQDGELWGWGANDLGQLGDGTHADRSTAVRTLPVRRADGVTSEAGVVDLTHSHSATYALHEDGTMTRWLVGDASDETGIPRPWGTFVGHAITQLARSTEQADELLMIAGRRQPRPIIAFIDSAAGVEAGHSQQPVAARVVDVHGEPIAGEWVQFSGPPLAKVVPPIAVTDAKGVARATFDLSLAPLLPETSVVLHAKTRSTSADSCVPLLAAPVMLPARGSVKLVGADLRGIDFGGRNLEDADFTGANLSGALFENAVLHRVDLTGCDLRGADFADSVLIGAKLVGSRLDGTRFHGADLRSVQLAQTDLRDADFSRASLMGGMLEGSVLGRATWRDASLCKVHAAHADLTRGDFRGVTMRDADLRWARLPFADFRGADVTGADLSRSDARCADLRGATRDRVIWWWADVLDTLTDGIAESDSSESETLVRPEIVEICLCSPTIAGETDEGRMLFGRDCWQIPDYVYDIPDDPNISDGRSEIPCLRKLPFWLPQVTPKIRDGFTRARAADGALRSSGASRLFASTIKRGPLARVSVFGPMNAAIRPRSSTPWAIDAEREFEVDLQQPQLRPGAKITLAVTAETTGSLHTFPVTGANAYAVGANASGQLGTSGHAAHVGEMTQLDLVFPSPVVDIASGRSFSIALLEDGTVWSVGSNNAGQLGNGTRTPRRDWERVENLSNVRTIAAGPSVAYALAGSTLYTWGREAHGDLIDGSCYDGLVPVPVPFDASDVADVRVGMGSAYALRNGEVLAWGRNVSDQLHNGGPKHTSLPTLVSGLPNDVSAVAAGRHHAIALVHGIVMSWGTSHVGALGEGRLRGQGIAGRFVGLPPGAVQIAAGADNGYALINGAVWGWGSNHAGQLGTGVPAWSASPVILPGPQGPVQEIAATQSTVFARSANTIFAWGLQAGLLSTFPAGATPSSVSPDLRARGVSLARNGAFSRSAFLID